MLRGTTDSPVFYDDRSIGLSPLTPSLRPPSTGGSAFSVLRRAAISYGIRTMGVINSVQISPVKSRCAHRAGRTTIRLNCGAREFVTTDPSAGILNRLDLAVGRWIVAGIDRVRPFADDLTRPNNHRAVGISASSVFRCGGKIKSPLHKSGGRGDGRLFNRVYRAKRFQAGRCQVPFGGMSPPSSIGPKGRPPRI